VAIIDVSRLDAKPREHWENKHILRLGVAVVIPPHLPHGVQNPSAAPLRHLDLCL
jgi:quercetin dioxygenase-like cupin family protein